MSWRRKIALLGILILFSGACTENPDVTIETPTGPAAGGGGQPVTSINITPTTATLAIGATQLFTATALDASLNPVTSVAFVWTSSNTAVATINSATGLATAIAAGTTDIAATSGGVTSNVAVLTVTCAGIPSSVNNPNAVPTTISTFGTSSISVDVTDCNGDPVPNGTQVDFAVASLPAGIGTVTSPGLTFQQGTPPLAIATATFTAGQVGGTATITATSGNATPASIFINVVPPTSGSIEFVSATPQVIGVKGSGQQETSIVAFSVKDVNGNPVADGTKVDFEMIGPNCVSQLPEPFEDQNNNGVFDAGESFDDRDRNSAYTNTTVNCPNPSDDLNDEFITPTTGSTVDGLVNAILHSGKVSGPVKVIATVHGKILSTGTTGVSIGGGVPMASGFHISADVINIAGNVCAGGYDDQISNLTAFIKDRFGNSDVLNGTSISFMTEAGSLISAQVTADDSGTVVDTLTSQGTCPIDVHQWIALTVTSGNGQNVLTWPDPFEGWIPSCRECGDPYDQGGTGLVYDLYWNTTFEHFPNALLGIPSSAGGTGWQKLANIAGPPFTHSGLTNGTAYYYVLVASDSNGRVGQSMLVSSTPRSTGQETGSSNLHEYAYPDISPSGANPITTAIRNPRDGWTTILAIVQGEETFFDANGNGVYDIGEDFIDTPGEPFIDADDNGLYTAPEQFLDINQNGIRDVGDPFFDANANGRYDEGDAVYLDANDNGVWDGPNGVWDSNTFIWNEIKLVFSGAPAFDDDFNTPPQTTSRIEIDLAHQDLLNPNRFLIDNGDCANFIVYVSDQNLNTLNPDSTITVSGTEYELSGGGTFVIPDGLSIGPYTIPVGFCDNDAAEVDPRAAEVEVKINWIVPDHGTIEYPMIVQGFVDNPPPLAVTTTFLPDGNEGVAYSQTLLASGGVPPYTWSITAGALPPGLTLGAASGTISGTPTAGSSTGGPLSDGDYPFTVQVSDSFGSTPDTQALSIEINP
jgi:hypothetical protein